MNKSSVTSDSVFITDKRKLDFLSIYNSYDNIASILERRGYKLHRAYSTFDEFEDKWNDFEPREVREKLSLVAVRGKGRTPKERLLVKWESDKLTQTSIFGLVSSILEKKNIANAILIYRTSVTMKSLAEVIENLKHRSVNNDDPEFDINFQVMQEGNLQYDVMKHVMMPKYRELSKEEKDDIFTKFGITGDKCPKMKSTNEVCKTMGYAKGTLLEITRDSTVLQGEKSITYRLVA